MSLTPRITRQILAGIVFLAIAVFAHPAVATAQSESGAPAVKGVVLDPDGKAVVNAAVVVRNETTGASSSLVTDATGYFSVATLPPGLYTVDVSARGFAAARRAGVRVTASGSEDLTIPLSIAGVTEGVVVSGDLPAAARVALSQSSLEARSAQSVISGEFIRDFTSPISDYSQVVQMAPGTFSITPNGAGLGDTKTQFRGFVDNKYTITFDGIPFNDTNDPAHHSWAFFPSQFIGQTVFDRSPGSAATIGPATYGGSINLLSRTLESDQHFAGSASYGSFATRLFDAQYDSGRFGGARERSRFFLDVHEMQSDGYQTFNHQKRDAFSGKYQFAVSDATTLTAFGAVVEVNANTPDTKGPTRANVALLGESYLLSSDPARPDYFGYNFYRVPTDFEYVGLKSNLGHGWTVDDKVYTYRYYNKQNFNSPTTISATSATDKLNSYRKYGNLVPLTQVSEFGTFRTGLWSEYAMTNRFQTPSDPRTWVDAALPNFHEKFNTTTLQPYVEYEFRVTDALRITPGVKYSYYKQDFTQFADNGKTVGNLGGAPSVSHAATYHSWLPSFDVRYRLRSNWSAYAQYAKGDSVPPSNVFDVKNSMVALLPKPVLATTHQVGSVWKSDRLTLDLDAYDIHFQNDYSSTPDPASGEPVFFLAGPSITKGVEAESTLLVGAGVSVYLNGTAGSAKYSDTGLWVANSPRDTETVGLTYQQASWSMGLFNKRVGQIYNDNKSTNQAVAIDPFNITNLFVNYTLRNSSALSRTRLRLSVNNLLDKHSIVGVVPVSAKTSVPAPGDILNLLGGRSVSLTLTVGLGGQ